ncbi:hypothetical protein XELAEV_18026838mg [Xenopus laevis]|uniref:Uncharacterized protein n=1 Tax=Xenopus laevis TaxID=8355 RepID=A0A974CWF2_XENLA|nr:hypothetical protein XELAEV_18026838mg [Xenopus laevis]
MTFAYSDLDKSRITEALGGSTDFLNAKDCKHKFRELEHSHRKSVAYDLHLRTLSEYGKMNRIPRGLRVPYLICGGAQVTDNVYRWNKTAYDCMGGNKRGPATRGGYRAHPPRGHSPTHPDPTPFLPCPLF